MATLSNKLRSVNKIKKQIDREIADFEDNSKEEDTTELENMLTELNAGLDQAAHEREKRKEAIKEIAAEVARLKEVVGKMEQEKEELAKTRDEKEEQLKEEMNRSRDAENPSTVSGRTQNRRRRRLCRRPHWRSRARSTRPGEERSCRRDAG